MRKATLIAVPVLLSLAATFWLIAQNRGGPKADLELLNVSYDPTRELWRELNDHFTRDWEQKTGQKVSINQSHGGSATQARAIIDGLEADVATLALFQDTNAIARKGLLKQDWMACLPNNSLPYLSTIVFVVRKGNPKGIKDWPDLIRQDVKIITPNPKTSGNGKLSLLAAYGYVRHKGGSEDEAREFLQKLYANVPVLDSGARGSTTTFAQKKIGDVHLTWESEAHLEVNESKGALEMVYPHWSIRAEPQVALVDANVDRRGTREVAQRYLDFLFKSTGQRIIAKHYYRPADDSYRDHSHLPDVNLFELKLIASDWDAAQQRFFADGGVFDRIYQQK